MTDTTTPNDNGQTTTPETPPAVTGSDAPFYATWSEDLRGYQSIVNAKSPEDVGRMLVAAEKRLGVPADRLLTMPDKPDDPEAWGKVWNALGRPEKPEDYGVQLGEGATDADKAFMDKFVSKAHAAGANKAVIAASVEVFNEMVQQAHEQQAEADKQAAQHALDVTAKAWGAKADVYKAEIPKLLDTIGAELKIEGLVDKLNAVGLGNSPELLQVFAAITDKLAEHDGLPGGGQAGGNTTLTPDQARAARLALESDAEKGVALRDRNHKNHAAVMAERNTLFALEQGKAA
jgi:hypothetical protein